MKVFALIGRPAAPDAARLRLRARRQIIGAAPRRRRPASIRCDALTVSAADRMLDDLRFKYSANMLTIIAAPSRLCKPGIRRDDQHIRLTGTMPKYMSSSCAGGAVRNHRSGEYAGRQPRGNAAAGNSSRRRHRQPGIREISFAHLGKPARNTWLCRMRGAASSSAISHHRRAT